MTPVLWLILAPFVAFFVVVVGVSSWVVLSDLAEGAEANPAAKARPTGFHKVSMG
jgi:hypothetical protein